MRYRNEVRETIYAFECSKEHNNHTRVNQQNNGVNAQRSTTTTRGVNQQNNGVNAQRSTTTTGGVNQQNSGVNARGAQQPQEQRIQHLLQAEGHHKEACAEDIIDQVDAGAQLRCIDGSWPGPTCMARPPACC